jgi:two-component system catabolic regulation response regulator CreB
MGCGDRKSLPVAVTQQFRGLFGGKLVGFVAVAQILVVEDELSIAEALIFALESDGWEVQWLRLGREAIAAASQPETRLVVLDVGLPDLNGFEVCKAIRRFSEVPILFLTARGEEIDRIVGLEIGADDYVVKPFSPREIAARVRVILKRVGAQSAAGIPSPDPMSRGPVFEPTVSASSGAAAGSVLSVDLSRLTIYHQGTPLQLTAQEFRVLAHLMKHPGRVFSRSQLLTAAGAGADAVYERNIDTHIKALRAKLRLAGAPSDVLQTHRGFGYSYRENEA